jgi:hypothetical protein
MLISNMQPVGGSRVLSCFSSSVAPKPPAKYHHRGNHRWVPSKRVISILGGNFEHYELLFSTVCSFFAYTEVSVFKHVKNQQYHELLLDILLRLILFRFHYFFKGLNNCSKLASFLRKKTPPCRYHLFNYDQTFFLCQTKSFCMISDGVHFFYKCM